MKPLINFNNRFRKYLKDKLIRILGSFAPPILWEKSTFAQAGEDIIIFDLLNRKSAGTYIDIGCHHPFRNSNTYLLYKMGWSGICIDPAPGIKEFFSIWRPRDLFLNVAISNHSGESPLYIFNDPALNSLSIAQVNLYNNYKDYIVTKKLTVQTLQLRQIYAMHSSNMQTVDVLSVDVEGLDLEVLESNDWETLRPKIVIFESRNLNMSNIENDDCYSFLRPRGYELYAKTENNLIMIDSKYSFFSKG